MPEQQSDHDLLIRLDEKVEGLIKSVSLLTDDHEIRLRAIERYVWKAIGALAVCDLLLGILVTWYFSNH